MKKNLSIIYLRLNTLQYYKAAIRTAKFDCKIIYYAFALQALAI